MFILNKLCHEFNIKSVSNKRLVIPFSANSIYHPHTDKGVDLDQDAVPNLRIHECGTMLLGAAWNYQNVCSPFWRVYFNLDAGAAVRSGGREFFLSPSTVIVLPAGQRYDCLPGRAVRHLWIHFSLNTFFSPQKIGSFNLDPVTLKTWRVLYRKAQLQDNLYGLRCASAAAILNLLGQMEGDAHPTQSAQLRDFLAWLDTTLAQPPSLESMTTRAAMSRRSFFRWFSQATGCTPATYLTRLRMREACRLLCFGNDSIEQIADATGYTNRHHFSRSFKAETGTSPAAFRQGKKH